MKTGMIILAVLLMLGGLGNMSPNPVIGLFLIAGGIILFWQSRKKKPPNQLEMTFSVQGPRDPNSPESQKAKQGLPPVGNVDAVCPHCNQPLDKKPGSKKKCPHCGQLMYVRTRPGDDQKVLVTEEQAELIKEQWSIVRGTHDRYLAEKKRYDDEKARLRAQFGHKPSDNDVKWGLLNQELIECATNQNWSSFRGVKLGMAEVLYKEKRFKGSIAFYFEVCYLDLNGPHNVSNILDEPELLKKYPPWNPKKGDLASGIITRARRAMKAIEMTEPDAKQLFFERANELKESFDLRVGITSAWKKVSEKLYLPQSQ